MLTLKTKVILHHARYFVSRNCIFSICIMLQIHYKKKTNLRSVSCWCFYVPREALQLRVNICFKGQLKKIHIFSSYLLSCLSI